MTVDYIYSKHIPDCGVSPNAEELGCCCGVGKVALVVGDCCTETYDIISVTGVSVSCTSTKSKQYYRLHFDHAKVQLAWYV